MIVMVAVVAVAVAVCPGSGSPAVAEEVLVLAPLSTASNRRFLVFTASFSKSCSIESSLPVGFCAPNAVPRTQPLDDTSVNAATAVHVLRTHTLDDASDDVFPRRVYPHGDFAQDLVPVARTRTAESAGTVLLFTCDARACSTIATSSRVSSIGTASVLAASAHPHPQRQCRE